MNWVRIGATEMTIVVGGLLFAVLGGGGVVTVGAEIEMTDAYGPGFEVGVALGVDNSEDEVGAVDSGSVAGGETVAGAGEVNTSGGAGVAVVAGFED